MTGTPKKSLDIFEEVFLQKWMCTLKLGMCTLTLPYIGHFKRICGDVYLEVWDVNLKFSHMYLTCCIMGYIQIFNMAAKSPKN